MRDIIDLVFFAQRRDHQNGGMDGNRTRHGLGRAVAGRPAHSLRSGWHRGSLRAAQPQSKTPGLSLRCSSHTRLLSPRRGGPLPGRRAFEAAGVGWPLYIFRLLTSGVGFLTVGGVFLMFLEIYAEDVIHGFMTRQVSWWPWLPENGAEEDFGPA